MPNLSTGTKCQCEADEVVVTCSLGRRLDNDSGPVDAFDSSPDKTVYQMMERRVTQVTHQGERYNRLLRLHAYLKSLENWQ